MTHVSMPNGTVARWWNGMKLNECRVTFRAAVLFWDVTQCKLLVGTDVSEQSVGPMFKGKAVKEEYINF